MADFRTALQALGRGDLDLDDLGRQLDALLTRSPRFAHRVLGQLEEAFARQEIDATAYTRLKRQINEFRRIHAAATEDGTIAPDATVFAREDMPPTAIIIGDEDETERPGDDTPGSEDNAADIHAAPHPGDAGSDSELDFNVSGMPEPSEPSSMPDSSLPTGDSWTPPGGVTTPELSNLGPGSIIKERFILDEVLGSGGMGKVYKGRDLLKVEAKDKNPYVALKVLNEDFRQHPEAFIALQRESSRQQRLAHPNIATVYDFDRIGRSGTQVFITMELMEGSPLNTFIKKVVKPKGGLPFAEAFPMIRDMAAALAYAHKQNIVHSDFKPGNAFLCNDGTVKVLDFGIARAVKNPLAGIGGGGDKTLFDAGKLGALTPAYASLEMLQGEDPDPRDDLYALACVAYELLAGRHPFNKLPATSAKENNLLPAPIKGLNRRQMRGLMRGLAFDRDKRSPDVEAFIEEFEGKANWHKNPWVISAVILIAVGVGAAGPVMNHLHEQKIQGMVAEVRTGNPQRIENILALLPELGSSDRATITDQGRDVIQNYFENLINREVDPARDRYHFDQATELLNRAEALYPDSAALIAIRNRLRETRDQRLYELNRMFIAALEQDRLIPGEAEDDINSILNSIAEIEPQHPLLQDPRLSNAYGLAAQDAINIGRYDRAQEFLSAGLVHYPDDVGLINIQDRLRTAIEVQERNERINELQVAINDRLQDIARIEDFKAIETQITELAELDPDDPILSATTGQFRPLLMDRIEAIEATETRADAERFADEYRELLQAMQLNRELAQVSLAHLDDAERAAAVQSMIQTNQQQIESLLTSAELTRAWEAELRAGMLALEALLPDDAVELQANRQAIADLYISRADEMENQKRYSEALALMDRGEQFSRDVPDMIATRERIDRVFADFLREREEVARMARIEGLKESLIIQARARDVGEARQSLGELQAELPEDDPFLTMTAPDALAEAYISLSASRAEQEDYGSALELAQAGLNVAPDNQQLIRAMQDYTVEVNAVDLRELFATASSFDAVEIGRKVDEIRSYAPARYGQLEREYINTLAERINELRTTNEEAATRLVTSASNVFPASATLARLKEDLAPRPWTEGIAARAAMAAGRLSEANAVLNAALASAPDHPEVLDFRDSLQGRIEQANSVFSQYRNAIEADDLAAAQGYLEEARSLWVDNPEYRAAASELGQRFAAQRRQESRILQREVDIAALRPEEGVTERTIATEPWNPVESDRACIERLAGYGRRARAICYDLVHDRIRGPLMVVIPGNDNKDTFAITKFEVSYNDYNKYCFLSGNCQVRQDVDGNLPLTGISLQEAREFAAWLSDRTGKTYRLPTRNEWEYAAYANGEQPTKDFNCRVTMGDQVLKGGAPVNVTIGRQNGWGLKNYIGNVQEWVLDGNNIFARGGAHVDPHANCDISLEREHNGNPDNITGFRLILEDVGTS